MKTETFTAWACRPEPDSFRGKLNQLPIFRTRQLARDEAHAWGEFGYTNPYPKMCVRKVSVTIEQLPERPQKIADAFKKLAAIPEVQLAVNEALTEIVGHFEPDGAALEELVSG